MNESLLSRVSLGSTRDYSSDSAVEAEATSFLDTVAASIEYQIQTVVKHNSMIEDTLIRLFATVPPSQAAIGSIPLQKEEGQLHKLRNSQANLSSLLERQGELLIAIRRI